MSACCATLSSVRGTAEQGLVWVVLKQPGCRFQLFREHMVCIKRFLAYTRGLLRGLRSCSSDSLPGGSATGSNAAGPASPGNAAPCPRVSGA